MIIFIKMLREFILFLAFIVLGSSESCFPELGNLELSEEALSLIKLSGKGYNELGKYNECLRENRKYFIMKGSNTKTSDIMLGICFPNKCTIESVNLSLKGTEFFVYEPESESLTTGGIIFLALLIFIVLTFIVSTILHSKSDDYTKNTIVKAFSGILAYKSLTSIRECNKFGCFNMIKFLSFLWVIYGHCFVMKRSSSIINLERFGPMFQNWWAIISYGGFFAVDIFFSITGFFTCYFLLVQMEKTKGKIPWKLMYFNRYLRIVPTYAFVMGLNYFIFPLLNSGPIWSNAKKRTVGDCESYWWTNFLFINNFIPDGTGNECFDIGWYLANDMQFFLIGPFLVYLYFKTQKKSQVWVLFFLIWLFEGILTFAFTFHYNLKVNVADSSNWKDGIFVWFQMYYIKPYFRFPVYLQGITAGLIFYYNEKLKDNTHREIDDPLLDFITKCLNFKKWISNGCFAIGVFLMMFFILIQKQVYDNLYDPDVWSRGTNAFVLTIYRVGFILGLFMFIFPVLIGRMPFLYKVMSHKVFEPLAKISYCGFLVHFSILVAYNSSQNNTIIDGIYFMRDFFSITPIVCIVGMIIYMIIELPTQNLQNAIIRGKKDI
ncbi:hypothetical protein SteCoe_19516 [Stentor coeruleus]|uniref:Acyltransferase 3 domain-containing protein n=1 Tax=Stentor coeruleus TaxID=5963 RepID=A0A1R2BTX6_9CILI|nr:hypothetical protein SteCoe_19516 [Stentor coeruleus]